MKFSKHTPRVAPIQVPHHRVPHIHDILLGRIISRATPNVDKLLDAYAPSFSVACCLLSLRTGTLVIALNFAVANVIALVMSAFLFEPYFILLDDCATSPSPAGFCRPQNSAYLISGMIHSILLAFVSFCGAIWNIWGVFVAHRSDIIHVEIYTRGMFFLIVFGAFVHAFLIGLLVFSGGYMSLLWILVVLCGLALELYCCACVWSFRNDLLHKLVHKPAGMISAVELSPPPPAATFGDPRSIQFVQQQVQIERERIAERWKSQSPTQMSPPV
ncbi:hypothetical protein BJ742DRAFT_483121 [Cladochytrium replicatum]|nr:hypothetical protein BJ742DRAFT_483121 [Cladochytrium replicatum]